MWFIIRLPAEPKLGHIGMLAGRVLFRGCIYSRSARAMQRTMASRPPARGFKHHARRASRVPLLPIQGSSTGRHARGRGDASKVKRGMGLLSRQWRRNLALAGVAASAVLMGLSSMPNGGSNVYNNIYFPVTLALLLLLWATTPDASPGSTDNDDAEKQHPRCSFGAIVCNKTLRQALDISLVIAFFSYIGFIVVTWDAFFETMAERQMWALKLGVGISLLWHAVIPDPLEVSLCYVMLCLCSSFPLIVIE